MTAAGLERVAFFLENTRRRHRGIVSPEGVPLSVELASIGERATAFAIDLVIWFGASLVIYLLAALLFFGGYGGAVTAGALLFIAFLVRNLYFVHFELAWQGRTPGKRLVGLRVIDRAGGPLLPAAVIARNLTREIEAFMPLGMLLSLSAAAGWEKLSLALWCVLFAALPFFNRDRMRGGDLIAGTIVVALPRRVLLSDLVGSAFHYSFTEPQLKTYGAFELQILEELLRRPEGVETARVRREVCDKICRRIGWTGAVASSDCDLFLRDFYTAERAYLEREQLFGRPRADKDDDGKTPG